MLNDAGKLVLLGRIGGAQGLRGEVRVTTFTAHPEDIAAYGALTDKTGAKSYEIVRTKPAKPPQIIAKLSGVDDRTAAEALNGVELFVPRNRLPDADEGEFYLTDLVGLRVIAPDETEIGEVVALHNFGAGDIIEIRHLGANKTELYPFAEATVPHIDITAGRLILVIPETI